MYRKITYFIIISTSVALVRCRIIGVQRRNALKRYSQLIRMSIFQCLWSTLVPQKFEEKKVNTPFLQTMFPSENLQGFRLSSTCIESINTNKTPTLSRSNRFQYSQKSDGLQPLNKISPRLIWPCSPFIQVRCLRYKTHYGRIGQVIKVPVDINNIM